MSILNINGVAPALTVFADPMPIRTECGVGALVPWAGKLWLISYVAHTATSGGGTGLYSIDEHLNLERHPASVTGTYANRMIHAPSGQLLIGPHLIDWKGTVRTVPELAHTHRLAGTMVHLTDPDNKALYLTMEGLLLELDLHTLCVTRLFDLVQELEIPADHQPHFKAGHTSQGRVVVANNTFDERDYLGGAAGGRLAEWDGQRWTILERTGFDEVHGRLNFGGVIFATGRDRASALLNVCANGQWQRYRLPKATQAYDFCWSTEWPRIREVEHERFLMDASGLFYELVPHAYGGKVWGVRPVSTHLRMVPDFCTWRGFLVLGHTPGTPNRENTLHVNEFMAETGGVSTQAPHNQDNNLLAGDAHAGLWFGTTDDLWRFGKPAGWGGPWCKTPVTAGQPSDPFLMTGFDKKVLHLVQHSANAVTFQVEVDFLGDGSWATYARLTVEPGGYAHHEFPAGFSAHWVRLTADADCTTTAHFTYS